jgi:hypothetical protein
MRDLERRIAKPEARQPADPFAGWSNERLQSIDETLRKCVAEEGAEKVREFFRNEYPHLLPYLEQDLAEMGLGSVASALKEKPNTSRLDRWGANRALRQVFAYILAMATRHRPVDTKQAHQPPIAHDA